MTHTVTFNSFYCYQIDRTEPVAEDTLTFITHEQTVIKLTHKIKYKKVSSPKVIKMFYLIFLQSLMLVSIFQIVLTCEPITVEDYENYAQQRLPLASLEYLQRGADKDFTLRRNCEAFSKVTVIPRYLIDVSKRNTNVTVLGKRFRLPVGISPSGLQKRWHPDGELATIRGNNENRFLYALW